MALEWSKDINFLGLFKRKDKPLKDGYPTKTYINLAIPDEREEVGRRGALTAVIALVVLLLFAKFGVYDYFARVMAKTAELNELTTELSDYKIQLADYDAVLSEYNSYEAVRMTNGAGDVALMDVLELVDKHVSPVAEVDSFVLENNILTLELSEITLDGVSNLRNNLLKQPIVAKAEVTNASRINSLDNEVKGEKSVALTLTLQSTAAAAAAEAAQTAATTTSVS